MHALAFRHGVAKQCVDGRLLCRTVLKSTQVNMMLSTLNQFGFVAVVTTICCTSAMNVETVLRAPA